MPPTSKERTYFQRVYATQRTVGKLGVLGKRKPASYATYREMRRQPTIAFMRALCAAPVISADWAVEAEDYVPDETVSFIRGQLMPHRAAFVEAAVLYGNIDYGWCPFEKVFGQGLIDGRPRTTLARLKPLLVDITDILVEQDTGRFAGFEQAAGSGIEVAAGNVVLSTDEAVLVNWRAEGDNHYGEPLLENIRKAWVNWTDANEGAERYDRKMAGAQWVVHYPMGVSLIDGEEVENHTVARRMLEALESSGSIAVPRKLVKWVDNLNEQAMGAPGSGDAWQIELKEHAAKQASFIDRMNYCDKCFGRGLLIPERAAIEGEYGTKADASTHAAQALAIRELEHRHVTEQAQNQIVDHLLRLNFGEEAVGTVRLVAAPLADAKRAFFHDVFRAVLAHPTASLTMLQEMDLDALMDFLDVPKLSSVAFDEEPGAGPAAGMSVPDALARQIGALFEAASRLDAP